MPIGYGAGGVGSAIDSTRRRWLAAVLALVIGAAMVVVVSSPARGNGLDVYTNQGAFEAATGATSVAWPANASTALPSTPFAAFLVDYSCDKPDLTTPGGEVMVTNPSGDWICYIGSGWNAGLGNTNPTPTGPTIVNNGQDDYDVEILLAEPVNSVGFGLLTNFSASERVTVTFEDETTEVINDGDLGTAANSFEFIGFSSGKLIASVLVDTTNGQTQNEGITGIWLGEATCDPEVEGDCTEEDSNENMAVVTCVDGDCPNIVLTPGEINEEDGDQAAFNVAPGPKEDGDFTLLMVVTMDTRELSTPPGNASVFFIPDVGMAHFLDRCTQTEEETCIVSITRVRGGLTQYTIQFVIDPRFKFR